MSNAWENIKALKETIEVDDVTNGVLQVHLEDSLMESMLSFDQTFDKEKKKVLFLFPTLNSGELSLFKIIRDGKVEEGVEYDVTLFLKRGVHPFYITGLR